MEKDKILYWQYERLDPERSVSEQNFDNGEILYKKFMSTASKINLAKSYLKLTLSVTNQAGGRLTILDNLAPCFLACETLFKSMYYKINNVTVSSIGDHVAQISAISNRLSKTKGYRDSVLKDLNFGKTEFSERQKSILSESSGEQIEQKEKPGNQASTIAVTVAGQLNGVNVDDSIVVGDTIEIYTGNLELLYRGIVQQRDNANQFQASPRPAVALNANPNWVKVTKVNNHRGKQKLELIFRPCLGVFQKDEWVLGHDFELSLFPHSNPLYKKFFMESLELDKSPTNDYQITVDNMVFYPCIGYCEHSLEQAEYECEFMETRMQLQNITSSSDIDRTFVIDKRTKFITMALQDSRTSGGNTLFSRTKFKVGDNSAGIETDLDLKAYTILYDIYQFPRPTHDQETTETVDRVAQAYYENLNYSDQLKYLPDVESLEEWKKLGPYYHYKIPIRKDQSNPKLSIKTSFRSSFSADAKPNVLLFDHFTRKYKLVAKNGRVIQVIPQEQGE